MDMEKERLVQSISEKTFRDGEKVKLTCSSALTLAHKNEVTPAVIGAVCNELNIRICQCQLGCFE